ncbi:MAG: hypothetical protein ACWGQW_16420, partial [bacterium]
MATTRIAHSVRLILAMFRLYADIETDFGKAIVQILKRQYPDQDVDIDPARLGRKLMAIARGQLQGNDDKAMDAIQDFLTYISVGSKYETDERGVVQRDEDGNPIERSEPKPWDFRKDFDTWKKALNAMYSNLKQNAKGRSMSRMKKEKQERSVDEAFGTRSEGDAPSGGEGQIPTDEDTSLGKTGEEKAALKEFYDLIDEHINDLKAHLGPDTGKLFELIYDDGIGDFGSDIKANMGQASALKEKYPDLYEKNAKRWSGFVGDLRKKLLKEIWSYIEQEMSHNDFVRLRDQFFADVDPSAVRRQEKG